MNDTYTTLMQRLKKHYTGKRAVNLLHSQFDNKLLCGMDDFYGLNHSLNVLDKCENILCQYTSVVKDEEDISALYISAILHDISVQFNESGIPTNLGTHALESAVFTAKNLVASNSFITKVYYCILRHSEYSWNEYGPPQNLIEKILFDADKLEWISVKGFLKTKLISPQLNIKEIQDKVFSRCDSLILPISKELAAQQRLTLMQYM